MGEWLESLVPWGTEVIVWAQSLSNEWLDAVWEFLTRLGYAEFYFVLLPFIYWCLNRRIGAGLGYVALLSEWVNSFIKHIFRIPRPNDPRIRVPLPETSPSFLSGHAQNAVVNWGYLAIRFRNPIFTVIAVIVILGIGLSRIFLGVHFPQDVIGGWLVGLVLLLVYIWAEEPVTTWIAGQRSAVQVALAIGGPVVLIFLHPADTEGFYPTERAIIPMAAMVGFGLGLIMERAWVRFTVEGAWWRRILRFLLGLALVAVLYLGSRVLIPEGLAHGLESLLRFVRYALVGWAGSFLAPWLFVKLRLAPQEG